MSDRLSAGRVAQWSTRGAFLIAGLAMCTLGPMVPLVKARLDIQEHTLGLLLLCVGIGSVLVMPFAGGLAARFGCRRVIVAAALVLIAILPILALGNSIAVLAFALFVYGASGGTLDVTMNVQAVIVEEASGQPMMSGFHGLFSVGGLFSAGGLALMMTGGVPPIAALGVVMAVCLGLVVVSGPRLLPFGGDADSPPFVLPRGRVLLLGVLCFVLFMAEGSVADWSGVFLKETYGLPATRAGYGVAAFSAMMTLNRLAGDPVVTRLGPFRVVLFGSLLAAAGFVGTAFAQSLPAALVGFALIGIGLANVVPVFFSAAGRQTSMPANLAVSAVTTLGYAGFLIGPPGIGFVAHGLGLATAFLGVAVLLGFVAVSARVATQ